MSVSLLLSDILHNTAQALLVPAMTILGLLLACTVVGIASVITEFFTERRHFQTSVAADINAVHAAPLRDVCDTLAACKLLRSQKEVLITIARNAGLTQEEQCALAKSELSRLDAKYQHKVKRSDLITKVGPMMGLICTLIPLGPGIVAMGQGQVDELASSLLIAFDGTVAGLVSAVVAMLISTVRKRWYKEYKTAMEALAVALLEKSDQARSAGDVAECGYCGAFYEHAFGSRGWMKIESLFGRNSAHNQVGRKETV